MASSDRNVQGRQWSFGSRSHPVRGVSHCPRFTYGREPPVKKAGVVVVVEFQGELYVLLVKGNPAYDLGRWTGCQFWSLPKGGKKTRDIDLVDTAVRECREETGICIDRGLVGDSVRVNRRLYFYVHLGCVSYLPHLSPNDDTEVAEARWVKLSDLRHFEQNEMRRCTSYLEDGSKAVALNRDLKNYIRNHSDRGHWTGAERGPPHSFIYYKSMPIAGY